MSATNIILGAGQAGAWAAVSMRQAGFGGRIVMVGEEAWRPYERPPLSKTMLTAAAEPAIPYFHDAAKYDALDIELILGMPAVFLDVTGRQIRLGDERTLSYDRLLLATGGRARHLGVPGGERALVLRTLDHARVLRARLAGARRVVCIGAGVIGLEIAASARALGAAVTVLEAAAAPMGRCVSPEGAAFVAALHADAGVDLRFGVVVEAMEPLADGGERVICRDGEAVCADLVVAGIGMTRHLALAEQAGLEIDGGIVVDAFGQTSAAGVYAAGDIAAFPHPLFGRRLRLESWRHAQNHGIAVGRAMAGDPTPYDDVPWFWTDQHGVNLQVAGLPAEAARTVLRREGRFTAIHLAADGAVIGVTAADNPRAIRAGTALIKARAHPDPAQLADPSVAWQGLIRR
jgi:3-phenylpropionate/trans-cinnamate dioxygenase ferredoxin reductase component